MLNLYVCFLKLLIIFCICAAELYQQYLSHFFAAEIVYENYYTAQSNQKTGLASQHWTSHPMGSLPPTPTPVVTQQKNGK